MLPTQQPPPIWIASNPRIKDGVSEDLIKQRIELACARIIKLGDGWVTCCRAQHPEEVTEQLNVLREMAGQAGCDPGSFRVAYQVTMHLGDSREQAQSDLEAYIAAYYPELSKQVDLAEWGPVGTADDITEWIEIFAKAGVDTFICRFGAVDQPAQVARFANEVLPCFR
jgi:alkanesulfonate monooxygenase SsuD/methylene tetrahydromethanopterin reductase-like flavin-dependent oxidoreductase (luciferase family)